MTSRGLVESDFVQVARFIDRAVKLAAALDKELQAQGKTKLADFKAHLAATRVPELEALRAEVTAFAQRFPMA